MDSKDSKDSKDSTDSIDSKDSKDSTDSIDSKDFLERSAGLGLPGRRSSSFHRLLHICVLPVCAL